MIALKENTGFCGGVNAGIRESKSEYVLLLNNDTIVFPEFITELVHAIERAPDIFSCQAKMLQIQDENKMDDAGNFYCALGWAFADGKGKPESEYNKTREIFASCAGAAIYRKEILDEIGYFDEEHFAYLEMLISDIVLNCMDIEICFVRLREYCMLEAEQVDRDIIYLKSDILQETICI